MNTTNLVDLVLESDDYVSVIREASLPKPKNIKELAKVLQDYSTRLNKCNIPTDLQFDDNHLVWQVKKGKNNLNTRVLAVTSFDGNRIVMNPNYKFPAPGKVNLNSVTDCGQVISSLDRFVRDCERDAGLETPNQPNTNSSNPKDEDDEEEKFELSQDLKDLMEDLKVRGENLLNEAKSIVAHFHGTDFKVIKGELYVSTEKEVILDMSFSPQEEAVLYSNAEDAPKIRKAIQDVYTKDAFHGNPKARFRQDMEHNWFFYVPVGAIPVKKATGPEAEALLDYYDGRKVRFQPETE